jgi:hypothetical protein
MMETEFYRSPTEVLPTFSLVLAATLLGLNATPITLSGSVSDLDSSEHLPAFVRHAYYEPARTSEGPAEQAEALNRFAANLLEETEDSPQEVVDALNRHFWELV